MKDLKKWLVRLLAVAGLAGVAYFAVLGMFGERTALAQTDPFLSRRVDQIEQRFYMLESRLNRVEQDTRRPATGIASTLSDPHAADIQYLRTQVDSLRTRLGEVECGLLRIDERTLPTTRGTRGRVANQDPCRREPNFPVQLASRPGS